MWILRQMVDGGGYAAGAVFFGCIADDRWCSGPSGFCCPRKPVATPGCRTPRSGLSRLDA